MSNTKATTPTLSTEPTAPDYEVPDSLEAWKRFDRLVERVLESTGDSPQHPLQTGDKTKPVPECNLPSLSCNNI